MHRLTLSALSLCIFSFLGNLAFSNEQSISKNEVETIQHAWEQINYNSEGKSQQTQFETLVNQCNTMKNQHASNAEIYIWCGIVESSYAGVKGGLGALSYAKESKKDLEKALRIKPEALQGSAYTSLGVLYYNVPGWPIGFGDDPKAQKMLTKALEINPQGIDPNYFYGVFLMKKGKLDEAEHYLRVALNAPRREGREISDTGRKKEVETALLTLSKKRQ